jgi:hypothetical protein
MILSNCAQMTNLHWRVFLTKACTQEFYDQFVPPQGQTLITK